jgi:hypothetical protein
MAMNLRKFESNIKSQYGEDGVISEIFHRIGTENKICVEFGAWDGIHLSNSWNLWHNLNWNAYLIEGDSEKVKVLQKTIAPFPGVHALEAYVMPEGQNSLDQILAKQNLPKNFDLLSIDIDGDDYHIFENLNHFKPRVIIIEFNPTVPAHLEMVQERGEQMGASALSIIKLGESKGYTAVHITAVNLFFITNEIFDMGQFEKLDLDKSFKTDHLVSVITSFDGFQYLTSRLNYGPELPVEPIPEVSLKAVLKNNILKQSKKLKLPKFKAPASFIPVNIFKRRSEE